jgi:hypothetical protein
LLPPTVNIGTVLADAPHSPRTKSQQCIEAKKRGHGRPVPQMKDVRHRNAATKVGGHRGGASGPSRNLDTCILKTPADAPLERCEGHLSDWTLNVEEEAIMANAQVDSFSQEGAGESHWANGCVLLPCFQMNRRPEVAGAVRLGEGRRHKLDKVIVDLDVVADALEGEELGKSSGTSYS